VRSWAVVLGLIAALALVTSAFAGMTVLEYNNSTFGKVIFDGKLHNDKLGAGKCMDCHKANVPFGMKKPGMEGAAKITSADHVSGKYCGICHNGTQTFAMYTPDFSTCAKCHKK
jgi:c(7)-type cytochrome triheme protein